MAIVHQIRTTGGYALSVLVNSRRLPAVPIRRSVNSLYLFLWNRIGRSSIDVEGVDSVLDVWRLTDQF